MLHSWFKTVALLVGSVKTWFFKSRKRIKLKSHMCVMGTFSLRFVCGKTVWNNQIGVSPLLQRRALIPHHVGGLLSAHLPFNTITWHDLKKTWKTSCSNSDCTKSWELYPHVFTKGELVSVRVANTAQITVFTRRNFQGKKTVSRGYSLAFRI